MGDECKDGAPGGIRTPNLLIRSQALCPVGLRAREKQCLLMVPEPNDAVNLESVGICKNGQSYFPLTAD